MRLKRIKVVRRGKRLYHYYKGKDGLVRLPDPDKDPDGFMRAYARCERRKVELEKRQDAGSLRTMVALWMKSPAFTGRAENTRILYTTMIGHVLDLMDGATLHTIERRDVRLMMDKHADTPGKANMMLKTLSAFYAWAISNEYVDKNPCKGVPEFDVGEHEPWPDHILKLALESTDDLFRRAVKLYLYTGQRTGDCCRMTRASIEGDKIRVRQQKTGKTLLIPLHPDLAEELSSVKTFTLLTNRQGKPLTPASMRNWVTEFGERFGVSLVPHGLRKNAVIALLSAGCSVAETAAITGQTYQLVEYYARQINQEQMARQAINKWNLYGTGTGNTFSKEENISIFPKKSNGLK